MTTLCRPGDILLYRKKRTLSTDAIELGEWLEDGAESREYYHVAIALDAYRKIEADGRSVAINLIDYGNFDAFRLPVNKSRRLWALSRIRNFVGQPYDWWLILDDGLRYLTRNKIHLPVHFIVDEERIKKICVSVARKYINYTKWPNRLTRNASPEDIWLLANKWPVPSQEKPLPAS